MDCVSMAQAVLFADDVVRANRKTAIYAVNPEKIVAAGSEPRLLEAIADAGLLIPDGIGAVLAARLGGARGVPRVPGADLMPELCSLAALRGYPVFLFGARPEVTPRACAALQQAYPGLRVVGHQNGYPSPAEKDNLPARINASGARFLFVGLGSPQQELWIHENLPKLTTVNVCQGVGGTLDVLAGRVKRAPVAWRKSYLEWLYRFLSEPSRLRRFPRLVNFAWRVWKEGVTLGESPTR
jgi:N-acetylglucosaminyldiphosphoundecaprenol N-acetyl-beta-D-mannosaminyltransferase